MVAPFIMGVLAGAFVVGLLALDCHRRAQRWKAIAEAWEARCNLANTALSQMYADAMWAAPMTQSIRLEATTILTGMTSTEIAHPHLRIVRES